MPKHGNPDESQRRLMGIALSMKRGKTPKGYSPTASKAAKSMTVEDLRDFARKPGKKAK